MKRRWNEIDGFMNNIVTICVCFVHIHMYDYINALENIFCVTDESAKYYVITMWTRRNLKISRLRVRPYIRRRLSSGMYERDAVEFYFLTSKRSGIEKKISQNDRSQR